MKTFISLLATGILFLSAQNSRGQTSKAAAVDSAAIKTINANSLGKHIEVLASNDFMGRKPFTVGETQTINYLQGQFKQMSLIFCLSINLAIK